MFCGEVINLINLNPNRCFLLSQLLPEAISLDGSRPSTDQEFRYLSLKEYSFILFHHIFWKRTPFPVWVAWVSWVPKVYLGVKTLCKKYQEVPMIGCNLAHGPILTTPAFWQWCYKHLFISKNHPVLKLGVQVIWNWWIVLVVIQSGK